MKQLSSQSTVYSTRKRLRHDGSSVGKLKCILAVIHNGIVCFYYSMAFSSGPEILYQSTRGISLSSSTMLKSVVGQK
jgi:hypothetical protein